MDDLSKYGDGFALSVLDLARRVYHRESNHQSQCSKVCGCKDKGGLINC